MAITSLNYINYKEQLEAQRDSFTPEAFDDFVRALQKSGITDMVIKNRLSMQGKPQAAPVIDAEGVDPSGVYSWKISLPVEISYQSSTGVAGVQKVIAQVLVRRQNILEYHSGIAIAQLKLIQAPGAYSVLPFPSEGATAPSMQGAQ
jgi:hypothetical protein